MNKSVKIYTTPTCPYCQMAKKFMKEKGVEYQELDVSSDTTARQEMMDVSGQMGVPVIVIDGQVIIGFNQQRLGELLRAA